MARRPAPAPADPITCPARDGERPTPNASPLSLPASALIPNLGTQSNLAGTTRPTHPRASPISTPQAPDVGLRKVLAPSGVYSSPLGMLGKGYC